MSSKKVAGYFIFLFTIILFLGYVLISFNNRFHFDDLGLSALVRDHGVWNSFKIMYFSWETTYLTLIIFSLLKWINVIPPFVYNISILLINIYCFFLLLKSLLQHFSIEINPFKIILLSAFFILLSYFSCRAMGNVSYWVTGQIVYCLFLSFLFLGIHFWLKQKFFLASICMFLFGHTRINYDAIFIGLYFCYFLFVWIENKKITINWKQHIPFLFFLGGVISYVIIPGNYHRADTFAANSPIKHLNAVLFLRGWLSAFIHLGGTILGSWKHLIVLPIGLVLGVFLFEYPILKKIVSIPFLIKCSIAFIVAYIGQATILLIAIKTPVGYGRIFYFLEFLLFILMLLYGIFFAFVMQAFLNDNTTIFIISFISLPLIFSAAFYNYRNYQVTTVFAKSYDSRIELLKKLRTSSISENFYLIPLPDSGILLFQEIDPQDGNSNKLPDNNEVYVRYYHLPFKIYLAK